MDKAAKAKSLWIYQVWEAIHHETHCPPTRNELGDAKINTRSRGLAEALKRRRAALAWLEQRRQWQDYIGARY